MHGSYVSIVIMVGSRTGAGVLIDPFSRRLIGETAALPPGYDFPMPFPI